MFAKLLKYEWKSTAPTLGILSLAAVGAGILGGLGLRSAISNYFFDFALSDPNSMTVGTANNVLAILGTLLVVLMAVAMAAYAVAVEVYLLYRFYHHKFTDRGYLTFTLPVGSHALVLSAGVNMVIWNIICAVVEVVAVGLLLLIGLGSNFQDAFSAIGQVLGELWEGFLSADAWQVVLSAFSALTGALSALMVALCCITLGASLAKRHKVLAAFGIYYGVSAAKSLLESLLQSALAMSSLSSAASQMLEDGLPLTFRILGQSLNASVSSIPGILIDLALLIGGYFLTVHLMEKKLNLP